MNISLRIDNKSSPQVQYMRTISHELTLSTN